MAKKEDKPDDKAAPAKKGGGLMSTILAFVIITGLGVGAGGLFGIQAAQKIGPHAKPAPPPPAHDAHADAGKDKDKDKDKEKKKGPQLVTLPNMVTNLAAPEKMWIRIEAAAVIEGEEPERMAAQLAEDIVAYLRTVTLDQVQGGSGFAYLKEDLDERVRLRGKGKVRDLVVQSFIVE
jgi:flagellar FliL protein